MSGAATVRIQLVGADGAVLAQAALEPNDADLIERQLELCVESQQSEAFLARLRRAIGAAVVDAVQYDLKPPTRAQMEFAMVIAAALALPLAPEVLRFRGHMHSFLDEYASAYQAKRRTSKPTRNRPKAPPETLDDDLPF